MPTRRGRLSLPASQQRKTGKKVTPLPPPPWRGRKKAPQNEWTARG